MKTTFEILSDAYDTLHVLMTAHTEVYLALLPNKKSRQLADGRYKDRIAITQANYDAALKTHQADVKARRIAKRCGY